jgi:hypothetical protein
MAGALLAGCGAVPVGETRTDREALEIEGARDARIEVEMVSGTMTVAAGTAKLLEAEFTYNVDRWKPVVERLSSGARSTVKVSQPEAGGMPLGNATSRWSLRLPETVPIEFVANVGAGEAEMTLGSLDLRRVEVAMGAGTVRLDLRGTPKHSYEVRVSGGVGEAEVHLPRGVGILATALGGIGEINVEGLERRGERWINAGHETDPVQLTVEVQGGIGEIRLIAD